MTPVIEKTRTKLIKMAGNIEHARRLVAALEDPSEWEFTGAVVDNGIGASFKVNPPRCACGHPVRYEFIIARARDGRKAAVGSTCIGHFYTISPALADKLTDAYADLMAKLAADRKAAKAAQDEEEIAELRGVWEDLAAEVRKIIREHTNPDTGWIEYEYFWLLRRTKWQCPEYKRACDYKRFYRTQADKLRAVIKEERGDEPEEVQDEVRV